MAREYRDARGRVCWLVDREESEEDSEPNGRWRCLECGRITTSYFITQLPSHRDPSGLHTQLPCIGEWVVGPLLARDAPEHPYEVVP